MLALASLLGACGPGELGLSSPAPHARAPSRATRTDENLQAFARLYGYVRWFHPTDAAAEADWRSLAAIGVSAVRDARDLGELRTALGELFEPLAPELELWIDGEPVPCSSPRAIDREDQVFWQHEGFVGTRVSLYAPPYSHSRVGIDGRRRRFAEVPALDAPLERELVAGLFVRMPMVLDVEQAAHVGRPPDDPDLERAAASARGWSELDVRQGAVIEVWNVLRHFYPYQHTVAIDWDALLLDTLHDAEDDASVADTASTLWRLVRALEDGHGLVGHRDLLARGQLPIRVELVDDRAVITGTDDPQHFAVGDVVEAIDGRPFAPRVAEIAARLSGTPQWRSFRASAWEALAGPRDRSTTLQVRRGDRTRSIAARFTADAPPRPPRPEPIHRWSDGVFYVDLTRAAWPELRTALPEIAAAPGVVFDVRGYPNDTHPVLAHLLATDEDAAWMQVPHVIAPDGAFAGWEGIGWHLRPEAPHIAGQVAFLVDGEAISYAESLLGYVEAHDLGTLIGSPSAGANGDIVRVDTLGGFFVVFTGMKVTRHDGSRFHGEGVRPEIAVTPTPEGLRSGRDEVLEAGLARVRGGARLSSAAPRARSRGSAAGPGRAQAPRPWPGPAPR